MLNSGYFLVNVGSGSSARGALSRVRYQVGK